MSNDQEWEQDRNPYRDSPDPQQDDRYRAPKPGMSTGMKVLIALLVLFGGGALLCCGGIVFLGYTMVPKLVENAADVNAIRNDIVTIDLPAGLEPKAAMQMDNFLFSMNAAGYESTDGKVSLTLTGMSVKVGSAPPGQEDQFRESMGKGAQQKEMKFSEVTTKKIKVKGVEREFKFAKGEDAAGKKYREVSGSFPGKSGQAVLAYQAEEDAYKENEVIKMIESIK